MRWTTRGAALALVGALGVAHCFEGGANFNQQAPGNNGQGGVDLTGGAPEGSSVRFGYGEIAVDPGGRYVLSRVGEHLVRGDLRSGASEIVSHVKRPRRIAFGYRAARFFVSSDESATVQAIDGETSAVLWGKRADGFSGSVRLYASRNDRRLAIVGARRMDLLDAATGRLVRSRSWSRAIVDVDFLGQGSRIAVTLRERWVDGDPRADVIIVRAADGAVADQLAVPNCASPLVVTPDGRRGFIAPTTCVDPASSSGDAHDPVSVLDLRAARWLRNLPGFGPVALAFHPTVPAVLSVAHPVGRTAAAELPERRALARPAADAIDPRWAKRRGVIIAFLDADNLDLSLFDGLGEVPSGARGRYHLMLIDPDTLHFSSIPLGESLPRYALMPGGQVVLVDASWFGSERIRVVDVSRRKLLETSGPSVTLDHFAVSRITGDIYLLYSGQVYWLSLATRRIEPLPLPKRYRSLNITPGGGKLLLLDERGSLDLLALPGRRLTRTLTPPGGPSS